MREWTEEDGLVVPYVPFDFIPIGKNKSGTMCYESPNGRVVIWWIGMRLHIAWGRCEGQGWDMIPRTLLDVEAEIETANAESLKMKTLESGYGRIYHWCSCGEPLSDIIASDRCCTTFTQGQTEGKKGLLVLDGPYRDLTSKDQFSFIAEGRWIPSSPWQWCSTPSLFFDECHAYLPNCKIVGFIPHSEDARLEAEALGITILRGYEVSIPSSSGKVI